MGRLCHVNQVNRHVPFPSVKVIFYRSHVRKLFLGIRITSSLITLTFS